MLKFFFCHNTYFVNSLTAPPFLDGVHFVPSVTFKFLTNSGLGAYIAQTQFKNMLCTHLFSLGWYMVSDSTFQSPL